MFRKKKASQDKATRQLQQSGVYTLGQAPHPFVVEEETVEAVKTKKIYSLWSGIWYTTVLSVLLFWVPPFGQMIAGYVGGRKAGTPRKGTLAAFAPMSLIFLLFLLRHTGHFVDEIGWLIGLPSEGAGYLSVHLPVLGPVFGFMFHYIDTFISAMWSHEFFVYPYVLTVIFGYVGGILSLQHRREMEAAGNEHPFAAVMVVPQQPPVQAGPPQPPQQQEVVMGQIPKDWKMKKDRKKGKRKP